MKPIGIAWIRAAARLGKAAYFVTLALSILAGSSTLWSQTTFPGQIGVEVADRPTGFVDAFKNQGRLFINSSGNPVPTDANGNPLSDGIAVIFDNRAVPEWLGYSDDPAAYQPDCSGTYSVSFQGQATLSNVAGAPTLTFANQTYNAATNATTVNVTLPSGQPSLMEISFTNTQLTLTSGTNTGIGSLQAIRPGFNATQIFDPAFVNAFAPFSHLRFMDWLGTNTSPGYYGDTGHHLLTWTSRSLPTDFYQGIGNNISTNTNVKAGAWGVSWEYVILLANATNKDIWINIPISATGGSDSLDPTYVASPDTSSYIYNLAYLLKNGDTFTGNKGLNPGLHIYIEHSNEVWNSSFLQYTWNLLAAEDEVNQGNSVLNNDGDTNQYDWAYRRHIKRLYEIAQIFQSVFGSGSLNTTIRPVYAWWQLDEGSGSNAANALAWFKNTYGPPSNYFYAMAQGDYFTATNYANDTTVSEVLSDMQASSNASITYVQQNLATAKQYGLPLYAYEGGPDNSNGGTQSTINVGVQILTNRDPGMDSLVQSHLRDNWFAQGGSSFGYFQLSGAYSRYGDYGATDDYRNLSTAKYNALVNLTGYTQDGVPFAPGDLIANSGNQTVGLSWKAVPGAADYNVKRALVPGGPYTTIATGSSTTYSDAAVTNGTTYYYVVTGVNSAGESAPSNEASATPQAAAPSAPTLAATAGSGQATLTWTAPAGAVSYNVYQGATAGGESSTPIATGIAATSYIAQNLTNGATYYFVVAAVNSFGTGASSNEATVTPSAVGSGSGLLAYEPFGEPAGPLSGVSGGGDTGWSSAWVVQNNLTDVPGYNLASTTPLAYPGLGTTGSYAVGGDNYVTTGRTLDVSTSGPFSSYLSGGLIGAPGQTIWLSFLLRKDANDGQTNSLTLNANGGDQSWWVQNPNIAVGYFGASSDNASGNPFWSLQYNGTTVQSNVPLVVSQPALLVLEVAFGASGAQNQVNLYVNPTSLGGAAPSTANAQFSTTNSLAFQSLAYYGGDRANESSLDEIRVGSSFAAITPAPVPVPVAPTNLTATAGSGQATLSWAPVSGAVSYDIYQGTTPGGEGSVPVATGITGATYTAQNLTNESTYYFIVAAVNSSGVGAFSTEASVTPTASAAIPNAPTGLTAAGGDGQVTLSWAAVPGASTYNVYQGATPGGEDATAIAAGVTATAYTATGLTDGTAYYFTVAAVNTHGASPVSSEASATPVAPVDGTNAPADFSVYYQVVAANPVPAGFNMQPAAGTNITENAWLADGGFSPYDARMSFTASQDGTATTFVATGSGGTSFYSSIAPGYFVGATALTYRYRSGAWSLLRTDTVSGYTANSTSTAPADNTITFASSGPQILSGDITWLDMDSVAAPPNISQLDPRFTIYYPNWATESQRGMNRGASAPWPYILSTDVPSSDSGGLSLELTDTNTETNGIWQYMQYAFVGPAYEEFQAGHTYEVDVWLKQSGIGDGSVTFTLSGLNITHTFTGVTGDWQHFTWTFPAVAGLPVNSVQPSAHLDFNAPGTMYVDNFQLYDAGWAPNTLNPQVLQAWTGFHPGTIRIWSNFGNSTQNYSFFSLDSWVTPEIKTRNTPGIGNEYEVPAELEHLPDALANVKAVGANPWLIVNMALSETEWGELIDYLSAPAGVGYAARRPADHPGPYTADFNTIYLEVGNEEWGTQRVPADAAYGQWAHFVISQAITNKSYFDTTKIKFIVNGFYLQPSSGSAAIAAAPEASVVDNALYSSGNTALSGDAYYQSALVQVPATNGPIINAIVAQQQLDAAHGRVYSLAAYEEGPGADSGSQSSGDNSLAAAIGAIDVNLYASQNGFGPQNLYMYQLGTGSFTSHTNFANGFRPHPTWEALQMRNNYCSGPMVLTNTNSVPTSTDGNRYPLIAVYTFRDANVANQADVVVLSRDLNNQTPVTLHFPATPTGSAQLYTLTGNPRLDNNSAMNIPIGSEQVAVTANYTFNMPPGSMYLFQVPMTGAWNNNVPAPAAPASLSASAGNKEVTLTWAAANGATSYNVLRGTANGGPYTSIATTSQIAYTDTSVTNGTVYYYVVTATNSGGASPYSPQATATPNVEDSAMTATPPPLDGSNTGAWANVASTPLTHYFSGSSPDTASYKTLWDANYLYLLVSVEDSTLTAPTEANVWSGDTVEVYFSGTDTTSTTYGPTDFQYAFPYGNGGAVVTEADHNAVTGVILGQQNIAGGYQMAIALPWTTLGTTPVAGQQYGLDVMLDDATSPGNRLGKLAWWATVDSTWSNPSLMGPLVLGAQTSTPSSVALGASNASPPAGSAVTLTATVSGSGSTPTGTVTFSAGGTTFCTATLNSSGVATCNFTPSASGPVVVTAQYQGDGNHLPSSASLTLNVYDASVSLELSKNQLVYPGAANVTVCIAPANNGIATGTVKILDGVTLLTTQTLQGNGCAYWYISPGLSAGTHVLTAVYSGDKNNPSGTSASNTVNVAPVPVKMSVSCWNASFAYGANYQCTVNVSSNAGSAQGAITYSFDSGAAVSVPLSGGNAQFTITRPAVGKHQVVIAYPQQTNYAAAKPQTRSFTVTP